MMHYQLSSLYGSTSIAEISTTRDVNVCVGEACSTVYISLANVKDDTIKVTKSVNDDDFLCISVTGSVAVSKDKEANRYYSSNFSMFDDLSTDIFIDTEDADISVAKNNGMLAITIRSIAPKKSEPVVLFDCSKKSDKPWNL